MASSWYDPGAYLVRKGIITQAQLDQARERSQEPLQWLIAEGGVRERDVRGARVASRATELGLAYVDLQVVKPRITALLCLPVDAAREIGALPMIVDGNTLLAAFKEPTDRGAIERAQEASGCRVIPIVAFPEDIDAALARLD